MHSGSSRGKFNSESFWHSPLVSWLLFTGRELLEWVTALPGAGLEILEHLQGSRGIRK